MMNSASYNFTFQDFITSLEGLLVKHFRSLQSLAQITARERLALSKGDPNGLAPLAQEKESLLEQIEIVVDSQHMVLEEIGRVLKMSKKVSYSEDILPRLAPDPATRIIRLRHGIITLSDEVCHLNRGNQALAGSRPDGVSSG